MAGEMIDDAALRRVERFIHAENRLLDDWQLQEWEALFTSDGTYQIPPLNHPDPLGADPGQVLFIIDDNREMIRARVERMGKPGNYVESPRSRIRHFASGIHAEPLPDGTVRAVANIMVYRARRGQVTNYVGRAFYTLLEQGDSFRIAAKRVVLDNDILQPQGSVGILL